MSEKLLRAKNILCVCVLMCVIFDLLGCDAFVRKFTRKHKKDSFEETEMVLVPQEYNVPGATNDELYQQYFLFWKSWQDELIESLQGGTNHKKQLGSIKEAIKNMEQLKNLLNEEKQKSVQLYIEKLAMLHDAVANDLYGSNAFNNRTSAETIKRNILRDLSYRKIKDYIKKK